VAREKETAHKSVTIPWRADFSPETLLAWSYKNAKWNYTNDKKEMLLSKETP
jgi:hypothetical protein